MLYVRNCMQDLMCQERAVLKLLLACACSQVVNRKSLPRAMHIHTTNYKHRKPDFRYNIGENFSGCQNFELFLLFIFISHKTSGALSDEHYPYGLVLIVTQDKPSFLGLRISNQTLSVSCNAHCPGVRTNYFFFALLLWALDDNFQAHSNSSQLCSQFESHLQQSWSISIH